MKPMIGKSIDQSMTIDALLSPVLTSDASISTSTSISIKDAYALVRTAMT